MILSKYILSSSLSFQIFHTPLANRECDSFELYSKRYVGEELELCTESCVPPPLNPLPWCPFILKPKIHIWKFILNISIQRLHYLFLLLLFFPTNKLNTLHWYSCDFFSSVFSVLLFVVWIKQHKKLWQ